MVEVWDFSTVTSLPEFKNPNQVPEKYSLKNYPNPFNPETTIQFDIPKASPVKIEIFNTSGQKIKTLVNANYQPGIYSIAWDGMNQNNEKVSSGVYFYHLKAKGFKKTKKMLLIE
jgi:flagellar hook assembly protein FlgD